MTPKIFSAQRSTNARISVLFLSLALCVGAGACKGELDPGGQVAAVCGEEVPPPPHLPADLYVAQDGSDSNSGTTPETAFATIQHAVDHLQPGQTLEIGPGEYFGAVVADGLGNMEVDTVIRAENPGTVILRGDIPAPTFAPLAGYNRVYVADFSTAETIHMVNEVDTLKVMARVPNVAELEWSPGHFYHDVDNDRLYVSTTDTKPASEHFYTLTVTGAHGLYLDTPERVHVQGLTATGFSSTDGLDYGEQTLWATYGIFIRNGKHSVIRDCRAYLNGRGLGISNEYDPEAGDNLIVGSRAWGNGGVGLSYDTGGIDLLYSRRDQVRNSEAFLNSANGISMRGGVGDHNQGDASYVCNSLSWGNHEHEFWIKMGDNFNYYGNSVAFGNTGNTDHLIRSVTETGSAEAEDSIVLANEEGLDVDAEFADPENFDFRLQATSRFVSTGPDGTDRGAFAYTHDIHYLSPAGDDANDGLSVAQARASLDAVLGDLSAGHTLYLTPGTYAEDVTLHLSGSAEAPIVIRGRGREPVILTGMVRIEGSSYVVFEHVDFAQDVVVADSDGIHFAHAIFMGGGTALSANNTTGLEARQSTFTGFATAAIDLPGSMGAHLAGNLYDNTTGPALLVYTTDDIRYSDYNSYTQLAGAWELGDGASSTLDAIGASHDELAQEIAPAFTPVAGSVRLDNRVAFYGGATYGSIFGAFRHDIPREGIVLLEAPSVHSVSSTTANIEWFTSHPTVTTLSWGPTSSVENQTTVESNRFASFSLTGLSPSTTYYLRLDTLEIPADVEIEAPPVTLTPEILEFTTAATDMAPVTYYVATTGDDSNTGLTSDQPFRSIQRAADHVNVGDSVLIAGGTYSETVRLRATGTESQPITFGGQPGELVMLDGSSSEIDFAFVIGQKSSLYFDSFFFSYHGSGASHSGAWEPHMGGQFNIHSSQDIRISRVLSDGRTTGDRLVVAKNVDGLQIRNTFDGNKLEGHYFENCPNLLIENSVFGRPMIAAFILRNSPDESALIRNNIFTDSLAVKSYQDTLGNPNNVYLVIIDGSQDSVVMEDNLFFLRYFSPDERALVMDEGHAELDGVLLFDTVFADPEFQGVSDLLDAGGELSLYDDSQPPFPPDSLWSLEQPFTFRTWFATNPDVVSAGIGLDLSQFDAGTGLPN